MCVLQSIEIYNCQQRVKHCCALPHQKEKDGERTNTQVDGRDFILFSLRLHHHENVIKNFIDSGDTKRCFMSSRVKAKFQNVSVVSWIAQGKVLN